MKTGTGRLIFTAIPLGILGLVIIGRSTEPVPLTDTFLLMIAMALLAIAWRPL